VQANPSQTDLRAVATWTLAVVLIGGGLVVGTAARQPDRPIRSGIAGIDLDAPPPTVARSTSDFTYYAQLGGIVAVVGGIVTAFLPLYFRDRSEARALKVAELQKAVEELRREKQWFEKRLRDAEDKAARAEHTATEEVRRTTSKIRANSASVAVAEGKADAAIKILSDRGFIKPPPSPSGQKRPRTTVVIVEDDPDTARALTTLFVSAGFAVTNASTVEDAIRLLDFGPHWIILDLMLPGGSGEQVIRYIRDEHLPIKVAVTTGLSDPGREQAVRDLKPEVFLRKPVEINTLFAEMTRNVETNPEDKLP
jgi:CheY-like chemotaxis protein